MSLPALVAIVAVMTAIGCFIDFLRYKPGRANVVAVPEDWWARFENVSRTNFGRKEAEFSVSIIDHWFGSRFFCIRRFVVCVGILLFWWIWGALLVFPHFMGAQFTIFNLIVVIVSYLGLSLSISFSRWVAIATASLMNDSAFRNLCLFVGLFLVTYGSMVIWFPMTRMTGSLVPAWVEISIFYSGWADAPLYIFDALYRAAARVAFLDLHWNIIDAIYELFGTA
jgi:hypothetical protein